MKPDPTTCIQCGLAVTEQPDGSLRDEAGGYCMPAGGAMTRHRLAVLTPETEALRKLLAPGIPYESTLSIRDHPEIRREYCTDSDAQAILDGIVPIVAGLLDQQQEEVAALLERRARWSAAAALRSVWGSSRARREATRILEHQATALEDFADVLRQQRRRWWL